MKREDLFRYVPRRTFLAGMGGAAAGTFLRPLFASAAGATPNRLLVIHRPCGTFPTQFFPQGGNETTFTLPSILQPFEPIKSDMVILNGIYCPRDHNWAGDQHGAGLITMMSGRRPIEIPGTNSGGDANAKNQMANGLSIDQFLMTRAETGLGGMASIQSTAYRPSSIGLPNFKVMSYGSTGAQFPESRADALFGNLFQASMPNLSPAELARLRTQNKSVLDFVHKDLTRLRGQVPKSQTTKLDAHLDGIQKLEARLADTSSTTPPGPACAGPTQATLPGATGDTTLDEAQHKTLAQNQLGIILSAFQCDLARVATFSFAHGNSALRFSKLIPNFTEGGGHHDVSHNMGATGAHAAIETFYSQILSEFLQKMKAIPDGDGSLLDHTLVVYFNECAYGWSHSVENMPVLMFGGKRLKLQTGKHLQFGLRYMNDVWLAAANAMGVPMATYGDTAFSKGAVPGLFG